MLGLQGVRKSCKHGSRLSKHPCTALRAVNVSDGAVWGDRLDEQAIWGSITVSGGLASGWLVHTSICRRIARGAACQVGVRRLWACAKALSKHGCCSIGGQGSCFLIGGLHCLHVGWRCCRTSSSRACIWQHLQSQHSSVMRMTV